jgi:hypothetical protein
MFEKVQNKRVIHADKPQGEESRGENNFLMLSLACSFKGPVLLNSLGSIQPSCSYWDQCYRLHKHRCLLCQLGTPLTPGWGEAVEANRLTQSLTLTMGFEPGPFWLLVRDRANAQPIMTMAPLTVYLYCLLPTEIHKILNYHKFFMEGGAGGCTPITKFWMYKMKGETQG